MAGVGLGAVHLAVAATPVLGDWLTAAAIPGLILVAIIVSVALSDA